MKQAAPKPDDLVYFRSGKQGAENHRRCVEIVVARGGSSSIAGVIRELIGRGLLDPRKEQAIIAACWRRQAGSSPIQAAKKFMHSICACTTQLIRKRVARHCRTEPPNPEN